MSRFEVKSRRTVIDKKGNDKTITETFLVENAVSFGDAEQQVETYWNCENEIIAVALSKVEEVINYPAQEEKQELSVFKAVLVAIFTDDDGNEKETKYPVIVWAKDVENAMRIVQEYLRQGYDNMTLTSINKTKIVEVI